jgi:site-specific recombinase XerD
MNHLKDQKTIDLLASFENFLMVSQLEGKRPRTIGWYKEVVLPFVMFCKDALMPETIERYVSELFKKKLKLATIDNRLRGIRAFLNFLHREGYTEENFAQYVRKIKLPKQYPYILTDEQVQALLKTCNKHSFEGQRNYTILVLFLDTGLRLSELINLSVSDLNLNKRSILVRNGKGGKDREVYLGKTALKELAKWLSIRGHFAYEDRLFLTRQGEQLKKRHVETILERLAKKAGLTGVRVSPHTLRHTFATNFIRNGGDVFSLQRILGHASIETCMIYVHLGGRHLQEAMMRFSPVDNLERNR